MHAPAHRLCHILAGAQRLSGIALEMEIGRTLERPCRVVRLPCHCRVAVVPCLCALQAPEEVILLRGRLVSHLLGWRRPERQGTLLFLSQGQ